MKTAVLLALFALCNHAKARNTNAAVKDCNFTMDGDPIKFVINIIICQRSVYDEIHPGLGSIYARRGGFGGGLGGGQKGDLAGSALVGDGGPPLLPGQEAALTAFKTAIAGIPGIANFIGGSGDGSGGGQKAGFVGFKPAAGANTGIGNTIDSSGSGSGVGQKGGFVVHKPVTEAVNRIRNALGGSGGGSGGGQTGGDAASATDTGDDEDNAGNFR